MTHILIKLPSGEELLGKGSVNTNPFEAEPSTVTLNEVFQVLIIPKHDGQQDIALFPWHLYSDLHKEFTIKIDKLIFYTDKVDKKLLDIYTSYTSKVIQPKKSGLIV